MKKDNKSKKIFETMFLIGLIALFIFIDIRLAKKDPIGKSELFKRNDFEKVKLRHQEKIYDKVFYGNSVVASAFIEKQSQSGYMNMGLVYGTIEDLSKILEKDMIELGSDLVIGANYLTFLDTIKTNPTYAWHRKTYEPYLYFQRDRLYPLVTNGIKNVLNDKKFIGKTYPKLDSYLSYGVLSNKELDDIIESHKEKYWNKDIDNYKRNLKSLQKVIDYCSKENINLRLVWLPWNNYVEKPDNVVKVEKEVNKILDSNGIEYIDFSNKYSREYFYDIGHLNYEHGAVEFTKEIDKWLVK